MNKTRQYYISCNVIAFIVYGILSERLVCIIPYLRDVVSDTQTNNYSISWHRFALVFPTTWSYVQNNDNNNNKKNKNKNNKKKNKNKNKNKNKHYIYLSIYLFIYLSIDARIITQQLWQFWGIDLWRWSQRVWGLAPPVVGSIRSLIFFRPRTSTQN